METTNNMRDYSRLKGITLVLLAALLWGVSGTVAQYLFHHQKFSPEWLVVVRLLASGVILLFFAYRQDPTSVFLIVKKKDQAVPLLLFAIFGMLGVQYTYFASIDHGNAAAATVLQYLAPVLIAAYLAIRAKKLPQKKEQLAILLALLGTFFLVTGGNFGKLSISGWAVFWGIASAFALAYYTLQPKKLLERWDSMIVSGWGMFIGGLAFSFIHPPWKLEGIWSFPSFFAVFFVIIFGTLIPFYSYMESLNHIMPTETSLLACAEPLAAVIFSVLWLNVPFGWGEWFGTICIILTVTILTLSKKGENGSA